MSLTMRSETLYLGLVPTTLKTGAELTLTLPEELAFVARERALNEGRDLTALVASAIELYVRSGGAERPSSGRYGEGRLFRRGRMFWTAVWAPTPSGKWKETRETTGTDDEDKARDVLRRRIRQIENHRDGIQSFSGPEQERMKVNTLLDSLEADYRTRGIKSLRHSVGHMKPVRVFFGERRVGSVTADLVRKYIETRKAEGRSNAKINREVELLNSAYGLAIREGRLNRKPHVPRLPERNARRGFFEKDEFERILQYLPAPVDDMARFAYTSGWRREEIRTLRWENVDRQAREITLFDSKNDDGRVIPLDDEGWGLFEQLWEKRRFQRRDSTEAVSEFVFHRRGRPIADSPFSRAWTAARRKAGLPGKLFHDFRRTAVRNLIRAGVPQAVAMAITGHKTDSVFRRYNVSSPDDKRDALIRQREYLAKLPNKSNVAELRPADSDKTRTIG